MVGTKNIGLRAIERRWSFGFGADCGARDGDVGDKERDSVRRHETLPQISWIGHDIFEFEYL